MGTTLSTFALAAIATQIAIPANADPELQFLQAQQQSAGGDWLGGLPAYLQHPNPKDLPLIRLSKILKLTIVEVLAIALALAVEEDLMVGHTLARVQAPIGGSRPTLGLLATALAAAAPHTNGLKLLISGSAMRCGLLQRLNETAPLPEQPIGVPLHLCLALNGQDGSCPGTTIGLGNRAIPLPDSILQTAARHADQLRSHPATVLVVRTGSPVEGRSVTQAIAQAMQRRPLFIETDRLIGLSPWLLLRQLLPVFCLNLAPGEHRRLPALDLPSSAIALCGLEGSVEPNSGTALSWRLPVPNAAERQQLWQQALGNTAAIEPLAIELAQTHRHGSGRIAQLGELAQHHSALYDRPHPIAADVQAAALSGEGTGLEALAQRLPDVISDEAIVVPPSLREQLQTLLLRCRMRDRLVEGLGAAAIVRYRPGVRALLVGASGTGKTLAAGWLATQLGLPLYRVDLAAISSKYIGETEKNLAQLLAQAEQSEVILLFDEADSLFGKRTEVKEANDRFANAQTNYLLQRIETFDGIVLLTSNSRSRFDTAFTRRLDLILEFPLPAPEERRSLWQSHLGDHHDLSQQDLNQLAATVDLAGGHIRNSVLAAAVSAQSEARLIEWRDLMPALAAEYRKLGQQMPSELKKSAATQCMDF